jgi:hypothetical protein
VVLPSPTASATPVRLVAPAASPHIATAGVRQEGWTGHLLLGVLGLLVVWVVTPRRLLRWLLRRGSG